MTPGEKAKADINALWDFIAEYGIAAGAPRNFIDGVDTRIIDILGLIEPLEKMPSHEDIPKESYLDSVSPWVNLHDIGITDEEVREFVKRIEADAKND